MRPYSEATDSNDVDQKQNLLTGHYDLEGGVHGKSSLKTSSSAQKGPLARLSKSIDERWSVKKLKRTWGPILEVAVRLLIVGTFFDDSLRTVVHFMGHVEQVGQQSFLSLLSSPLLKSIIAGIFLCIGVLAQLSSSFCLVAGHHPDASTKALIAWTIAQPVLYGQLSNGEVITQSMSLIGGLLMLRAHLVHDRASNAVGARTQLLGRLLLPSMYMYYSWLFLSNDFFSEETNTYAEFFAALSKSTFDVLVILAIAIGSVLVFFGLKSRVVALLLAFVNLAFVTYMHPFFLYISLEGGKWKYDEVNMPSPNAIISEDVKPEDILYDPAQVYDMHRYYFFLGVATSGALLLLAQFGPGEIAVQKNEVLLPVVRAID